MDELTSKHTFVGRTIEMAQLSAGLARASEGQGRIILLAGEPGIGKTRLWQEFAEDAHSQGATTLYGRCYDGDGAPPYWPWVQALRDHVRSTASDVLVTQLGSGAPELAEVVPQLRDKLPGLKPPAPLESPAQSRFRFFDSMAGFLRNASASQPLVLMLDDLQWADTSTLLLIEFLAREISSSGILLVGAYRDVDISRRHPLSRTLGSLVREETCQRIQLAGLERAEVEKFIFAVSGVQPEEDTLQVVHKRTAGNPMFLTEVAGLFSGERSTESTSTVLEIPEGIRDAIGRRLDGLSDRCNEVLSASSVIGVEFDADVLARLFDDLSVDELLDALEEAVNSGLVQRVVDSSTIYGFTHGLVQETLEKELRSSQQRRLHGQILDAKKAIYGGRVASHAADLARHALAAGSLSKPGEAAKWSLVAGERALTAYSFDEALGHFERAIESIESRDDDGLDYAHLLFNRGKAQIALGQNQPAITSLVSAFEHFIDEDDLSSAIEVALSPVGPGHTGVPELIERALELAEPDSSEYANLLSHHGLLLSDVHGDYEAAQRAFDLALEIAEQHDDLLSKMWILARSGHVDLYHGRPDGCLEKHRTAIDINSQIGDPFVEIYAGECVVSSHLCFGNPDAAMAQALKMQEQSERARYRRGILSSLESRAYIKSYLGEWQSARGLLSEALKINPTDIGSNQVGLMVERATGNPFEAMSYEQRLIAICESSSPGPITCLVVRSHVGLDTGDTQVLPEASGAAEMILGSPAAAIPAVKAFANVALSLAAIQNKDQKSAADLYLELEQPASVYPLLDPCFISLDRLMGLLAMTSGELDSAHTHFERAVGFLRTAGYGPELALTSFDYGQCLRMNDSEESRVKADAAFSEAKQLAERLGMTPLISRIESVMEEESATRVHSIPGGLTIREMEVLRLISAGHNNAEIGEQLFITSNTVRKHVSNILGKLGVANRTEAANFAFTHGLNPAE